VRRRTIIAEHPVWSTKLIAATAIILDEISPRRVLLFAAAAVATAAAGARRQVPHDGR